MKRLLIIVAVVMGATLTTNAQTTKEKKKVAVVLSGGGAKGMAHIGVLKVLERAGIPVDIITGTSMGSIVGGLYATGMNAERLDSIVRTQDWNFVLSDKDDLSHQSLRERERQNTYILSTSLNLSKKKKKVEGGIILGKNIGRLFAELTYPYNDSIDFNKLPIPFACVATNIVDNTEYVFHSGVLSRAMRASMAIPGAFSPVRMKDMVLVDGGLRNNFPTDVAKEMGADYIIGSSVKEPDKTAEDLKTTSNILLQLVDLNCKNKFEENLSITDIPIMVDVEGYSAASFSTAAVDTLIRRGEEAAMAHWDEIIALKEKLGLSDVKPHTRIAIMPKPLIDHPNKYKVGELVFENLTKSDEQFIRTKFGLHEGDSIDSERANLITTSIRLDLFYKFADYRIINNAVQPDGSRAAKVIFIAGERKSNLMSLGVRFDDEELVALQANAAFPVSKKIPMQLDFTLRLKGDFTYRNIHRNITFGEQPTDIWDIAYGINGTYKFPWNITFNTDLTMHSRRGYTDAEMNDNRLYWDASLTKSIHQGQWVIKLRGYDLLGQVSNLRYSINAQGRTETWTNSMRRYALLTISYRFSQKPKKEDK